MPKKILFSLPGITCVSCVARIEGVLKNLSYVQQFHVDLVYKTLAVVLKHSEINNPATEEQLSNQICAALEEVGDEAIPESRSAIVIETEKNFSTRFKQFFSNNQHLLKALLGITTGAGFLLLSLFTGGLPVIATYILTGISTVLSLYLGKESFIDAAKKLFKARTLEMNALFTVSSITAIIVTIGSLFVPWLPSMLDAGLLIFGFRHLGIAIEDAAKEKVTSGLSFRKLLEKNVYMRPDDLSETFIEAPIENILPGKIIRVFPGQVIPVDGVALTKEGLVNTSRINGSHLPVSTAGLDILAGMTVLDQHIDIQVSKSPEDSYLCQMANILEEAEMQKAPLETRAEKILRYFVPVLFVCAAVAGVAVGLLCNPLLAIQFVTTLLVSACPCTLGSIVPLAVTVGIAKAAHHGVLFKSGKTLQAAAEIDTVIFDLNGTLTQGNYKVQAHHINTDFNAAEMLSYWWELEKDSTHAIGVTIRDYLKKLGYTASPALATRGDEKISLHAGKKLIIGDEKFLAGNVTRMQEENIDLTQYQDLIDNHTQEQIIFFTKENCVVGYIILEDDSLKHDARAVLQELQASGKEIHICTGADRVTALRYANKLGVPATHVLADCVPVIVNPAKNSKSAYIQTLQEHGKKVAMICDAENDIIPLTTSDLSILVKSPSSTLRMHEKTDVIINSSALTPILSSFTLAKNTVSNIKQNLAISFGYNFSTLLLSGVLLFAFSVALNPGIAVALMIGQAGLVLLNVYRFKQKNIITQSVSKKVVASDQPVIHHTTAQLHNKLGIDPRNVPVSRPVIVAPPANEAHIFTVDTEQKNVFEAALPATASMRIKQ
jgi:Cu2+-exporting ATPase